MTGNEIIAAVKAELGGLGLDWLVEDEYAITSAVLVTCEVLERNGLIDALGGSPLRLLRREPVRNPGEWVPGDVTDPRNA